MKDGKYSMLVLVHSNACMKFESWVHATTRCSIISLLNLAKQSPDHIQFKPDTDLSAWLAEGCNIEFRSARMEAYNAVLSALRDLKVCLLYTSPSPRDS